MERKNILKIIAVVLGIGLAIGAAVAFYFYQKIFKPNVPDQLAIPFIHIPTNSSFEEVVNLLKKDSFLLDESSFRIIAERMKYAKNTMRAGRFKIEPSWSNYELVRHLRGGKQATVKLVLTNERLPEEVAGKAARFIEADSSTIWELMNDPNYLQDIGHTKESLMSLFIPNTYDFYWNSSPETFMKRMIKENNSFWEKGNRKQRLEELKMTKNEVYTLASIIERETLVPSEKPQMAGVYLNRLKIGMALQADPTSVFARRDFGATRVTDYHTEFDSPYNTYKYAGLPPGPISMASIGSIDAVLNADDHKYMYFCAKGDGSGTHNFAKSLSQHNQNAIIYKRNLRKRGLR